MTKPVTKWTPAQPGAVTTTNAGVARLQENGVARLQESGTARVLEDSVITPKKASSWSES